MSRNDDWQKFAKNIVERDLKMNKMRDDFIMNMQRDDLVDEIIKSQAKRYFNGEKLTFRKIAELKPDSNMMHTKLKLLNEPTTWEHVTVVEDRVYRDYKIRDTMYHVCVVKNAHENMFSIDFEIDANGNNTGTRQYEIMTDRMKTSMKENTVGPTNEYEWKNITLDDILHNNPVEDSNVRTVDVNVDNESEESGSTSPTSVFQSSARSVTPPTPVHRSSPSPEEPPVLTLPRRSLSPLPADEDVPSFDNENEKTCSCQ